jgi:hypothetical protein
MSAICFSLGISICLELDKSGPNLSQLERRQSSGVMLTLTPIQQHCRVRQCLLIV